MEKVACWIRGGDIKAFFWVNHSWKCSFSDWLMPVITHLGGAVWCIAFSLALLINGDPFWHNTGIHMALSLLISHAFVAICKKILPRRRPFQVLDNVSTGRRTLQDASFPSGHATASFCMATVLSFVLPAGEYMFYGLAFMVSLSRVYLGLHYPSDILFGGMIGTLTAWLLA